MNPGLTLNHVQWARVMFATCPPDRREAAQWSMSTMQWEEKYCEISLARTHKLMKMLGEKIHHKEHVYTLIYIYIYIRMQVYTYDI